MSAHWVSSNMDWGLGHDKEYLAYLCGKDADVLLLQEAKTFDLAKILPAGWHGLQDTTDAGTRGSCIAFNGATMELEGKLQLEVGARPFINGKRVKLEVRHIASATLVHKATGEKFYAVAAHLPPARFRELQPGMGEILRKMAAAHPRMILGTDANQPIDHLAHQTGLRAHGTGIVGLLNNAAATHIVGDVGIDKWGENHHDTDHPAIRCEFASSK